VTIRFGPNLLGQGGDIDVELKDHLDEVKIQTEGTQPELVKSWSADEMAEASSVHSRGLVCDDNDSSWPSHPPHLPHGSTMIAEVSKSSDGVTGVELSIRERKSFPFSPGEASSHRGEAVLACDKLGSGDIDSVNRPGSRQERKVLAVADADFKNQCTRPINLQQMP
jgi:hypothetical protein